MLSYQIREYYEFALVELKKFEDNIKVLFDYEEKYREISSNTLTRILALSKELSASDGHHYINNDANLIKTFNDLNIELSSKFDLLKSFGAFSEYKQNIAKYKSSNNIIDSDADNFIEQINILFQNYQSYIQSQNDRAKAVVFMQNFLSFTYYFNAVKNFYTHAINMFDSDIEAESKINCSIMEIQLLAVDFNLEDFISCLNSIQKIYTELRMVMYKDSNVPPLDIVKIESGSLLSKVLGDNNIIEALGLFLTKTINLCFKKFTKEGQLLTHAEVRNQLVADLDLRDKLNEMGLDITSTDEHITKAFALITKETLRLASSTPKFKINGEIIECSNYTDTKYLEANKIMLIEESTGLPKLEMKSDEII